MDAIEITAKESANASGGFFKQVFKLNEDSQGEVLNMMQYVAIGFIPAIILIYVIRYYVPDPDDDKGSLTILAEIFAQTFSMLLGIYFIHRIIIYFPTYSGIKYERFHIINILMVFIMVLFSIKTKLGEKAQILVERAVDMWSGNTKAGPAQGQGQGQVRVTQPITGSMASGVPMTAPPPPPQLTSNRAQMGMGMSSMVKDFNAMYSGGGPQQQQQQQNQQQQQMMDFEPMAANEAGWGNSSLF